MAPQDVTGIGSMILGAVVPLAALWIRLRFRLRRERERCIYLLAATVLLVGSGAQEQRDDGTRLTLEVGNPTRDEP